MVPFGRPTRVPEELELVSQVLSGETASGHFNRECDRFFRERLGVSYSTMTPSSTFHFALPVAPGKEET